MKIQDKGGDILELTRDSEKLLCCMYKIYLERRKKDISRSEAKIFEDDFYKSEKQLADWSSSDITDCMSELCDKNYIRFDIIGNAKLENETIVYMENRFKKGAKEVIDFIVNFIPG